MATAPPPFSPRDQQRQAKEYWRAQRQAARMQQKYWRGMRRSSVTGPIVLITIGIVALLIETGRVNGQVFWDWYRQWWPLLLIGIGVISLGEWLLDRNSEVPVRRSLGGLVFLIILLSLIGGAGAFSHHFNASTDDFGFSGGDNPFSFLGTDRENDLDNTQAVTPGSSIEVQVPHGDVTITASMDNQIHVHTHEVVHTTSQDDADRIFKEIQPKLIISGTTVLVRVDGPEEGRADLTIEVPKTSATGVTAGHGDITVGGLTGPSTVTAKHGDVKFDAMVGNINAHVGEGGYMHKGDFSAHAIDGDVTLDGGLDDVTISEVTGKVLLTGEYFGDTHVERVAKGVHFHSSRTDMEVATMPGDMTLESDDLHISQVTGPMRIVTRSKNIDANQVTGDIHIENTNGDVNVVAAAPLGNIQIDNKDRPITVTLPPGANFDVNGTTRGGDVSTDYNLSVEGTDNSHSVSGQVGSGGIKLQLDADHGDIAIRKGEAMPPMPPMAPLAAPVAPGAGPAAPGAPPAKVRHLKTAPKAPVEKPTDQ